MTGKIRESLKTAIEYFAGKPVTAVEVGVAAGANAKRIFLALNIQRMFLIDSWKLEYNVECYKWLIRTCQEFEGYMNKAIIWRHDAIAAASLFRDGAIDYLYLDDNHAPAHVLKELEAYYPKVSSGGIISGHDWADNNRASVAVKQFCKERNIKYHFAQNEGEEVADWWFYKP